MPQSPSAHDPGNQWISQDRGQRIEIQVQHQIWRCTNHRMNRSQPIHNKRGIDETQLAKTGEAQMYSVINEWSGEGKNYVFVCCSVQNRAVIQEVSLA